MNQCRVTYHVLMTASSILRERTAQAHAALEEMPFAQRLAAGEIDRIAFLDYLQATNVLIASLRTDIQRHGSDLHQQLLETLEDWCARLESDIKSLNLDKGLANTEALDAALRLVQESRCHLVDDPDFILGLAYVLYGSHNGHRSIASQVSRALALPDGDGMRYFRATQDGPPVWREFKQIIDAHLTEQEQLISAVEGANSAYQCFEEIFEALGRASHREPHSSAVNPEAGHHPVAGNSALRKIATHAGIQCHNAFGYLVFRFGERGEAFARSDGAWLANVFELSPALARERMGWLAGLLSARGIPSVCLQYHIDFLLEGLASTDLMEKSAMDGLRLYAQHLREQSFSVIDENAYSELIQVRLPLFDPRGAELLLRAVTDQQSGLAPCADRIEQWMQSCPGIVEKDRVHLQKFLQQVRAVCGQNQSD